MIEATLQLLRIWDAFVECVYAMLTHGRRLRRSADGDYHLLVNGERWGSQDYERIEDAVNVALALQEVFAGLYEFKVFRSYAPWGRPSAVIEPAKWQKQAIQERQAIYGITMAEAAAALGAIPLNQVFAPGQIASAVQPLSRQNSSASLASAEAAPLNYTLLISKEVC